MNKMSVELAQEKKLLFRKTLTDLTPSLFDDKNNYEYFFIGKPKKSFNQMSNKRVDFAPHFLLYEADDLSLDFQKKMVFKLMEDREKFKYIFSITYSGNKSYHILVELKYDIKNLNKVELLYSKIWEFVGKSIFGENIKYMDKSFSTDWHKTTRTFGAIRTDNGKVQTTPYLNINNKLFNVDEIIEVLYYDYVHKKQILKSQQKRKLLVLKDKSNKTEKEEEEWLFNLSNKYGGNYTIMYRTYKGEDCGSGLNYFGGLNSLKQLGFSPLFIDKIHQIISTYHPSNISSKRQI